MSSRRRRSAAKQQLLDSHLLPTFGHLRLDRVGQADIEAFKAKKSKEGLAPKTINNALTVLRTLLSPAPAEGTTSSGFSGTQGTTPSRHLPAGCRGRLISLPALGIIRYKLLGDPRGLMRGPSRSHRGLGGSRPPPWAGGTA